MSLRLLSKPCLKVRVGGQRLVALIQRWQRVAGDHSVFADLAAAEFSFMASQAQDMRSPIMFREHKHKLVARIVPEYPSNISQMFGLFALSLKGNYVEIPDWGGWQRVQEKEFAQNPSAREPLSCSFHLHKSMACHCTMCAKIVGSTTCLITVKPRNLVLTNYRAKLARAERSLRSEQDACSNVASLQGMRRVAESHITRGRNLQLTS